MIERTGFTGSLVLDVFTSQAHDLLPCAFLPMVIDAQTLSPMNQPSIDAPGKSRFQQVRFLLRRSCSNVWFAALLLCYPDPRYSL
jgi:hypothetical protein